MVVGSIETCKRAGMNNCPQWDMCDKFNCHNKQVCQNWTKYWGNSATAERMARLGITEAQSLLKQNIHKKKIGKCVYCERKLGEELILTRDHIIPSSRGGKNSNENLVNSCERCNRLKDNMMPEQFCEFLGDLINIGRSEIPKDTLITILYNTRELIKKIAPYRSDLFIAIDPIPEFEPKQLAVIPKQYPAILKDREKEPEGMDEWRIWFSKKYAAEKYPDLR